MSKIARRIAKMSEKELWDHDFPSARSIKGIFGTDRCRNIRIFAGLIIGPENLDNQREALKKCIPKTFK